MMNDIRWSEHPLYADVVKRVPPELHPTLARAVDLRAADAWLHEGTMPAGLDSDGKSLGGQQGPAFLRAAGRRYMRRWATNEHGEQFGKGRIPDFPVTRSHPPASWPSAVNSSICRTYRKTAGEESRRRSPVANRWMRP